MRLLYIDIDTLRPDHLGCYGYLRDTSPNIDAIAADGVRFERCYTSDAPCLPSRSSLFSGCFGIHHGAVSNVRTRAEMFNEGPGRRFRRRLGDTSWPAVLRSLGLHTVSFSPFADRHSAFHYYAGFDEFHNPGRRGLETVDDVVPAAADWLQRHGADDGWFLHLNLWDVHAPARTPEDYGQPFADQPIPDWLTEEVRQQHWSMPGLRSAQGPMTLLHASPETYPRQPRQIDSMESVRRLYDGYDTAVRYADAAVGRLTDLLRRLGVWEETAVVISSDHGETLGELNGYAGHHLADECTMRVPMIIRWPGKTDSVRDHLPRGLHYNVDLAATTVDLLGGERPEHWDARSFATALRGEEDVGRPYLVLSQLAQTAQRSVLFREGERDWLTIRTYDGGAECLPETILFDVAADPHETRDLAEKQPDVVARARDLLQQWREKMLATSVTGEDPLQAVLAEGPEFSREVDRYLQRLRDTGREDWADTIAARRAARLGDGEDQ